MSASTSPRVRVPKEIVYPERDGKPLSDNTLQYKWIAIFHGGLDAVYRDDPDVFVAADLLWYPIKGDNKTRTAPDTMVAIGRPKGERGSYRQWDEAGIAPQVVFEVLSPGNRAGELKRKFEFYQRFGVDEYYQYDPDRNILRAWIRRGGTLEEIPLEQTWISPKLAIRFEMGGDVLQVYGPDGTRFVTYVELMRQREQEQREKEAVEREKEAVEREKEAAQSRAERLAAQLEALGIKPVE